MKIIQNIFSVTNIDIHKVVTILGFKFKFKNRELVNQKKILELKKEFEQKIQELDSVMMVQNQKLDELSLGHSLINYRLGKVFFPPSKEDIIAFKESNELMQVNVPRNFLSVGKYTYAHPSLNVEVPLKSKIGAFCSVAPNVMIGHGEHPIDFLSTSPYFHFDKLGFKNKDMVSHDEYWTYNLEGVDIGNDVWIGTGVFIKNGVKIGDGAVIGAHAVVTKDVPPYAIVVGSPAKVIKYRFTQEIINDLLELKWWDLDIEILKKVPYDDIEESLKYLKGILKK